MLRYVPCWLRTPKDHEQVAKHIEKELQAKLELYPEALIAITGLY
jgi:hypothetical protein